MNELVSIIIPTYKGYDKLKAAIQSVLEQTYSHIELIVVDDNNANSESRRKTEEIMKSYICESVIYLKHETNKNGSAARNTGLQVAKGEYIGFLDDDDTYDKTRIEKLVNYLRKEKVFDGVYSSVLRKFSEYEDDLIHVHHELTAHKLLMDELALGSGSNIFVKREVVDELKGFDEAFIRHQDLEFMLRVLDSYRIGFVEEPLVIKGYNMTYNVPNYKKYKQAKLLYFDKFDYIIETLSDTEQYAFFRYHYNKLLYTAFATKDKEDIRVAKRDYKKHVKMTCKEHLIFIIGIDSYNSIRRCKLSNICKKIVRR